MANSNPYYTHLWADKGNRRQQQSDKYILSHPSISGHISMHRVYNLQNKCPYPVQYDYPAQTKRLYRHLLIQAAKQTSFWMLRLQIHKRHADNRNLFDTISTRVHPTDQLTSRTCHLYRMFQRDMAQTSVRRYTDSFCLRCRMAVHMQHL